MRVNIDELKQNENNPRNIDWHKLEELKRSIKDFPEMLELRPIVVNKDYMIIGGNMRYRAAKELGFKEIEIVVMEQEEKEYEFLIKDNVSYGEWNWNELSEEYNTKNLIDWGLDVPLFLQEEEAFSKEEKQKGENLEGQQGQKLINTKKALYLFYTTEERKELIEIINSKKGEVSNEEYILSLIKNKIS
jgi:hypothetical protein